MQSALLAGLLVVGLAVDISVAQTSQTIAFLVTYDPPTLDCRTCTDNIGAIHPTGDCLQLTAGCPAIGQSNAAACVAGICGDDDAGIGGDILIQPPPPSPNPTTAPIASPSVSPTTTAPTLPAATFSPTASTTLSPSTVQPTGSPSPPAPPVCAVSDTCNCENVRLAPAANTSIIDISCLGGGFVSGNSTANQTLDGVVIGECSLSYNQSFDYTDSDGQIVSTDINICYTQGFPVVPNPPEECSSNTGVIIIIVICVLLLLAVIAIGVYYIVHTTNAHADGPKFTSGDPHSM